MIDILLSTYNGEKYLNEQIISIQNQSEKDWRLLVRDDGSSDNTLRLLESFASQDKRIILIKDDKGNLGVMRSFEILLVQSNADYIMFADQDDVWLANKIRDTWEAMLTVERKTSNIPLLVFTDVCVVDAGLKEIHPSFISRERYDVTKVNDIYKLVISNCIMGCTVMINSKAREKVLPFSRYALMHDWWIGLVVANYGKNIFLDKVTSLYRQHENNQVGSGRITIKYYLNRLLNINKYFMVNYRYIQMVKDLPFKMSIPFILFKKTYFSMCSIINKIKK